MIAAISCTRTLISATMLLTTRLNQLALPSPLKY